MAEADMEMDGFDQILNALDGLAGERRRKIERKALQAVVEIIQPALLEATPVLSTRPGTTSLPPEAMKEAVQSRISQPTDGRESSATADFGKLNYVADWVDAGHANVRGGYSKTNANGKRRGPGAVIGETPSHPFVRATIDATAEAAHDVFVSTMTELVEKEVQQHGSSR